MQEEKKYYTIGQISKLYHIGADSIRYYEEKGLIVPKRSDSGYRLYMDTDIWCMNVIEEMRRLDISVDRIKKYLDDETLESSVSFFEEELAIINEKIKKLEDIKHEVEETISDLNSVNDLVLDEIKIVEYPERKYFAIFTKFTEEEEMDFLMKKVSELHSKGERIIGNNRMAAAFDLENEEGYNGVILYSNNGDNVSPKGKYLTISYSGSWKSREYAEKLVKYAGENGIKIDTRFVDRAWIDIHATSLFEDRVSRIEVRIIEE